MHRSTQITRSADGIIGGVCSGLGRHFDISPNLLRLFWMLAVLFFGTGFLLYIALWWIIPREDQVSSELPWGTNTLRRTRDDRKIFGVCGGIARRWDLDPSVVRLAALALATLSFGVVVFAYLTATVAIPVAGTRVRASAYPVDL